MTPEEIAWWWCCQAEDTRQMLVAGYTQWLSNPFGTLRVVFDALLDIYGFAEDTPRRQWWLDTFQVSYETIVVDGVDVEVVLFQNWFWTPLALFIASGGAPCPEPCTILKFALDHI